MPKLNVKEIVDGRLNALEFPGKTKSAGSERLYWKPQIAAESGERAQYHATAQCFSVQVRKQALCRRIQKAGRNFGLHTLEKPGYEPVLDLVTPPASPVIEKFSIVCPKAVAANLFSEIL